MFESLQRIFGGALAPGQDPATEATRLRLATCVLLLEVAHADADFSPEEKEAVTALVRRRFDLDAQEARTLLQAAEQARRESGDLYRFARQLNDSFSRERKLAVMELLWDVVFSDGVLAEREDAIMHKLSTVLGIRHSEMIALKLRARDGSR